ncbi:general secretion pathway protein GspE [Desulfuromonas versatilis]|uniref:General secretion pathway protein GspE n=1 Tax=Desulfuromonas versatilis TaxID=2802975 RepID=A0ABM7NFL8_9BACT|nr:general secretion pathway protein GspE [Desulfuromonas versatilis]BCR05856.1 general secretion pathway protein GspE [Desulfuromonas versatilis]
MALKLGELLVKEKLLSATQLEDSLRNQVIFGGRLGTNLIEMGLLSETQLAQLLSKKLGVPYVNPEHLMTIPEQVIKLIPAEIAGKYRVIPLRRDNRRLYVATADPTDYKAIEEIAFRTGFIIKPVVTTELRLILALEKYYRIPRERRYVPTSSEPGTEPEIETPTARPSPEAGHPSGILLSEPAEADSAWYMAIEDLAAEAAEMPAEKVWELLAQARNREDIADTLTSYLGRQYSGAALFLFRDQAACGWRAKREGETLDDFSALQIPLETPSVLATIHQGASYFLGRLPETAANARISRALGAQAAPQALLVPLKLANRVVGVLYVDDSRIALGESLLDLKKLAAKAAMAFEILILRNKILMT